MTEGQSNFLTEINQDKDQCASKNLRHRQEINANRFEQVAFFEEEPSEKKSKHTQKQKKSILSDSDSSSDNDSSENEGDENDDSSSESSCQSDSYSEEYNIWDNSDFDIYGIDLDNLKFCNNEEQKFFTLYKLRYCQIREFLTKTLTQKQHQDINVNILKIVKALSQNKVLKIQCHNYNYFQPLQQNKAYQKFAQHFGNYKNTRKIQQAQQKSQYIQKLKDKSSFQKSFIIKQFEGIKAPANRASFSSSQKEISPQPYFLTLRESHNGKPNQMTLITKNRCDSSQQTQDTFNSQTKRTLKDFEIDSDQKETKQKQSQQQAVSKQTNNNFQITSLTDIGDLNEQHKQIDTLSHALNQTPQKKFLISHIQTNNQISKTAIHLSCTSTPLLPQQKNLLKSINQSPNTYSDSISNKIDNTFQNHNSQKQPQLNNFVNCDSQQIEQNQQIKTLNISTSPFICQNLIDFSPKNKTKQRILPHIQMNIPPRESQHNNSNNSNCYYQLNNSQMIKLYNTKANSSLSCSRKQTNLNFKIPLTSYKQFDKVPDLKQIKQVNQNNSNINKITQIRSTSNYTNSDQTPYNFNESTLPSTPLSILNRLPEQSIESTFSKHLEKQSFKKVENQQDALLQSPKQDSSQLSKMKMSSIYNSSSANINNKLVRQKQVLVQNQSYGTLLHMQREGEQRQTTIQSVNQEYMICNADENQNKNITNTNQSEMNKIIGGASKNNNNQIYYHQIQKNIFKKTFFKNQYINNSSTINKQLVENFKQIIQN
ncbi:hypothetical protein TTHERM_00471170 (macronuclear) [Tetrahymena thermophila SB210]|uniref:Uncharacterized protein n=1 Tax=Tetrahymena thermophila (strain SB210) TaxID=312017 RepID=I7LTJ1_TETTS|nr:hypothetical protein TTHERM_00471170 [Tetrahymena thermophila SB210]EAR85344.2 hypothetical protein TTHERM_00471170 [Tetrahymena thermophila SB210]|eukprot:XP_001033007.2 hypothetical protein TTHERM_00471170 [Tetrahymena thermophila SB210]